ncbi:DUF5327 family protein [Salinicoccus albus]|uniref:DUF5327 family protein n=1 Tax=Salinicoccus albus TaxID=418756 RepID=UPI0003715B0F|nr:DUF5327 family protein [Salinicoccus albus]
MKQQIIQELKQELHRMEVSSQPHEFDKHVYAMERLLGLLKQDDSSGASVPGNERPPETAGEMSAQDKTMLEMMGGRVDKAHQRKETRTDHGQSTERARTDDGFGNGDSLFDF